MTTITIKSRSIFIRARASVSLPDSLGPVVALVRELGEAFDGWTIGRVSLESSLGRGPRPTVEVSMRQPDAAIGTTPSEAEIAAICEKHPI